MSERAAHNKNLQILFSTTIALGAYLLFAGQLILGRLLLIEFGSMPSVWLTALVVFQIILLLAYGTVHAGRFFKASHFLFAFTALALISAGQYFFLSQKTIFVANVTPWHVTERILLLSGTSLFLLSLSSPLLQKFYSFLPQRDANDPYFLYSASNLGSFAGLLLFPFLMEPLFGVSISQTIWLGTLLIFLVLFFACTLIAAHFEKESDTAKEQTFYDIRWLLYALIPSALSFGATSTLINDIAPLPLLSMVPLALYLLTYILAFGKSRIDSSLLRILLGAICMIYVPLTLGIIHAYSFFKLITILAVFFVAALFCHQKLADHRPSTAHLTRYYLMIALGGALGGFISLVIIPFILPLSYEFFLFLMAVFLLSIRQDWHSFMKQSRKFHLLVLLCSILAFIALAFQDNLPSGRLFALFPSLIALACLILWPGLMAGFSITAVALSLIFAPPIVDVRRDFYGIKRVADIKEKNGKVFRTLLHGTTLHGTQQIEPLSLSPLSYYSWKSAVGDVLRELKPKNVAVVGMGTATLSCKVENSANLTFFEIDPAVVELAQKDFHFLEYCPPKNIVLGDARFTLASDQNIYDLIVLDAFSSDAIPVHLLTREAFKIYLNRLAPNGIILAHISNRYLNLRPVLHAIATEENLFMAFKTHKPINQHRVSQSEYVLLTRNETTVTQLHSNYADWTLPKNIQDTIWTDDKILLFPTFRGF